MSSGKTIKNGKPGSFQSMNLTQEIFAGINRLGYKVPTPVQRKALPIALAGMDIVCMSRTGSGKTCVFLVPLLEKIKEHDPRAGVRGLVLSPTRELAMQTFKFAKDMAKFTTIRIAPIIGGDGIESQFELLSQHPDIIIATPGRLMHHLREISTFKLNTVKMLIFDEADRLFEMGFAEQLNEIIRDCPIDRQTLLFSATMPKMLVQFTRAGLRDPQLIRLDTDIKLSDELRLAFFSVRSNEKVSALLYLVRSVIPADQQSIIFTATRHHSEFIYYLLEKIGISATLVYGTMDQDARSDNLKSFRNGAVRYLVVTDLAARGIDVPLLNNVINFHFPPTPKLFVHRCGRAARQGRIGYAFSFVDPEELAYAMDVHIFLGKDFENPVCSSSAAHLEASDSNNNSHDPHPAAQPYDLLSMQPTQVHTGLIPQDCLDRESEFVRTAMLDDTYLVTSWRICENAMKQYRRTRNEATKPGVKLAKEIVKTHGILHIHPLIMGCDSRNCSDSIIEKANFVKHLQTFRPAQTVFETGIGFGTGSQAIKGVSKKGSKESQGVDVMKAFRRQVQLSLERNKSNIPASDSITENNFDEELDDDAVVETDEYFDDDPNLEETSENLQDNALSNPTGRIRLSKAARKRAKREPNVTFDSISNQIEMTETKEKTDFKDSKFYMTYGTENETKSYVEASLQPQSGLRSTESMNAMMIENAILDISPDDAMEMNKKKRMLRWDAKKRKFVKQTLAEMAESGKGSKRIRTESGVSSQHSSLPAGEMYSKWKKKTRREIDFTGSDDALSRPNPNFKFNDKVPSELRTAQQVRTLRKKRDNSKIKNMSKDKRKSVLNKKNKAHRKSEVQIGTKAGSKKVKVVMRKGR